MIDASGTWRRPNPAGADGLPALGERAAHAAGALGYAVPDRARPDAYAGRHTVVIGAGDSAFNAVNELTAIAKEHPGTKITWAIRRAVSTNTFGGGEADELPERGALGVRARKAVQDGSVELVTGFRTERVDGATVLAEDGRAIEADQVVVLTGYRPDLGFLSEMRLDLDPTLEAPRNIAVQIDPNLHACGSVSATGAKDLAQPEPDLYLVGMKSYGRAPTFLAMTGYEQVRSVVAELAGDHDAAARVELELPDTGVCGGAGVFDDPESANGGGCCGTPRRARRSSRSAGRRSLSRDRALRGHPELVEQGEHALLDLVADAAHVLDATALRVGDLPVVVALAGVERAGVATPHGDDHVCAPDDLVGPGLGELPGDVDPELTHGLDRDRVDGGGRSRAPGPADRLVTGVVGEEAECHLRAAGVLDTEKENGRPGVRR